jgi:hypothetical protein
MFAKFLVIANFLFSSYEKLLISMEIDASILFLQKMNGVKWLESREPYAEYKHHYYTVHLI